MSTHLFTLPLQAANGSEPSHLVLSTHEAGARDKEIWAIVPAAALSWHLVTLPAGLQRNGQRLQTVLQSLLEERVLEDTSQLHMALQPNWQAGQTAWVAVCQKAWLQSHLNQLGAAGHIVHRIVPEWAPNPQSNASNWGTWIQGTPESAQLWVHDGQSVWQLPLQAGLQHWAAQLNQLANTQLAMVPANLTLQADPAVADAAQKALVNLQSQTQGELSNRLQTWRVQVTQPLTRYQQAVNAQWDLAQFEFAAHGSARWRQSLQRAWQSLMRSPEWRPARWCAGLLLASQLIGINLAAWQLNAQVATHKSGQKSILQETFPNVTVVDAPLQMAREVERLRQASGQLNANDLESMLASLGHALPAGLTPPNQWTYEPGQLRLKGFKPNATEQQSLQKTLAKDGYLWRAEGDGWLMTMAPPAQEVKP